MIAARKLITTRSPKLILDENIPREIVLKLQQAGQDIAYIREARPWMDDEDIIAKSGTRVFVPRNVILFACEFNTTERKYK
ncbi:MAG: DUF5615 family PIN-like protein [Candidatus Sigynarchaeota archaeon]